MTKSIKWGLALPSPLRQNSYAGLPQCAADAGRSPALVGWFSSWLQNGSYQSFNLFAMNYLRTRGITPVLCWQIQDPITKVAIRPEEILRGDHDRYLRYWAEDAATHFDEFYLRILHEFDGDWYPWSLGQNGWTPETHRQVWTYLVALFRGAGATNVKFVWCPNREVPTTEAQIRESFPGTELVDVMGVDGYDFGNDEHGHKRQSWEQIFDHTLFPGALFDELAPDLPKMVCELGTVEDPTDPLVKARSISHWTGYVAKDRYDLMGWCWMNDRQEDGAGRDNTFQSSAASLEAFKAGIALSVYESAVSTYQF